ncbi:hypothetical protein [Nocardia sp. NPDC049526]|uniref:hypothetical protein n=1 Tax=Nocardia sp. NPDC049526 TaxID=3364316 RepID=UPI00379C56F2
MTGRELATEWQTAVLCYDHPGAMVEAFDTTDKTSGTPTRWKLTVGCNEIGQVADLPKNLSAKTPADFELRLTRDLADILHGEPGFFEHGQPDPEITPIGCEQICLGIIGRTATDVVDLDAAGAVEATG